MAARVPPQAVEAEISILGGLMLEPDVWDEIGDIITTEDFYKNAHRKIFDAMKQLHGRNNAVDLITVTNYLTEKAELAEIGGTDYLVEILNKTVSAANIAAYAEIVQEKSLLRKMIQSSTNIIEKAYEQDYQDITTFMDAAEAEILTVSEVKRETGLTGAMEIIKNSIRKLEELSERASDITGVPTGFRELDKITAGLHGGEMAIIAARPSMGKTAFALNVALHAALHEKRNVAFFSLEMTKEQIMVRLLAQTARVNLSDLRVGRLSNEQWSRVIEAAGALSECNLFIDDTPGLSPFEIRAKCRRHKKKHGLDLVIIDYLQLMDLKQKVESRERAVSEISKRLKALAHELKAPVIPLSQLNRKVEGRSDQRPILSDLRESGSIEQDADLIMMLFRPDYYEKNDRETLVDAEIIIGKHRNGATGTVKLKFEPRIGLFRNPDPVAEHPLPPPPPRPKFGGGMKNFAPV